MFREQFKHYKSRKPTPSFKDVLDFNSPDLKKLRISQVDPADMMDLFYTLKPLSTWEVYEILDNPGLIFIKNPFTSHGQRYWITRCLRDYPRKPNKSNLDPHKLLEDNENWWDVCQKNKDLKLLEKLRWITFGYHHNWDTKIYSEDSKSHFPDDLNLMCKYIAKALKFSNFEAEAAIVNYYHMDSTLSGHTDHSEQNLEAPLFSFSFGQTAIFLLGGKTIDVKPTAVFLHSGDIVIMSKDSRLSYHGVPRILKAPSEVWNSRQEYATNFDYEVSKHFNNDISENCDKNDFWLPFNDYLKTSRININVRQVLNRGQKRLRED